MYTYGGIHKTILTRDCMHCILNLLEEEYWYKLKLNSKLCRLIKQCYKQGRTKDLAKNGHIESLNGRAVRLIHICMSGSVSIIKRFIGGTKDWDWNSGVQGHSLSYEQTRI